MSKAKLSGKKLEAVKARAVKAIRAGRMEYAHPQAAECFPVPSSESGFKHPIRPEDFHYATMEYHRNGYNPKRYPLVLHLSWGMKGVGFGEATFTYDKKLKTWSCDDECMGPEFVAAAMAHWINQVCVSKKKGSSL